jgi:hypothetical protein
MIIENGTAIVLVYVLVSTGVIITFMLAVFVIGWFIGRLRERRRGQRVSGSSVSEKNSVRMPSARIASESAAASRRTARVSV